MLLALEKRQEHSQTMVYVSPLRRTIHTAIQAFKDHPDPSRIKFVVHPLLREMT